jgi:hypothetical protein
VSIAVNARGQERWLEIPNLPGYYVSDNGRVRGRSNRILKTRRLRNGYERLGTWKRDWLVHDLVLRAFVGPRPDGHEADHLNNDRSDNRLDNLRWVSLRENRARRRLARGERHWNASLTAEQVHSIRLDLAIGRSIASLVEEFGVDRRTIRDIRNNVTWRMEP